MIDVGTVFVPVPAVKDRLLVRLIVKACPGEVVITTGDQPAGVGGTVAGFAAGAFGFNAAQLATGTGLAATAAPQV